MSTRSSGASSSLASRRRYVGWLWHLPLIVFVCVHMVCASVAVAVDVAVVVQKAAAPNPAPEWITELMWDEICCMAGLPAFKDVEKTFASDVAEVRPLPLC